MERDILVALFNNATLLLALSVIYEVVYILPLRNRHLQFALIGILIALTCSAVMSYRAGHAQTSTTANIYSHAIRTADEKAAEVLENIVKQSEYTR